MAHKLVVYALVENKFIQKNEIVVKVGWTSKPFGKRLSQYPKNSKMIFEIHVLNPLACVESETVLLRYLRGDPRVKPRCDVGYEYYQLDAGDSGAVFQEMADVVLQYVGTGGVDMSIKSVSEYTYDSLDCGTEDVPPDPPSFAVVEREKERENEREKEYLLCALSCFFPIRHYDHHPKSDDGVRRKAQGNTDVLRLQHDVNNTARL